mmetsp:Transcript_112381/g.324637  ORF Transcript_112381/g.324637 Transcript_112381/m.324637 type:complete len:469 (+) Transcript_112381:134-1540(+)
MNQPNALLCSTFADLTGLSNDLLEGLLLDEATSDVVLRVQEERLPAHRALLGARSPVFKAMFFGAMRESGAKEVDISAFSAPTMKLLLHFLYAGVLEAVRLDEMVPLMACADHYGVTTLRDNICQHLHESMSPETACIVLALARTYQQEVIQERYLSFVLMNAQQVFRSEGFLQLDVAILQKLLDSDDARIEEVDLFKALVRWYRHRVKQQDVRLDEKSAAKLFASIRYAQMTGQQLVKEVRPLVGEIVPKDLYVNALEQVAAPDVALTNEAQAHLKQAVRRQPPIGSIKVSEPQLLLVQSTSVKKVGCVGWNCTAVVDPSTSRTRIRVEHLTDHQNGIGIAIFDPERNALRGGSSGFPNPNQWGADCLVGVYGTGCFFGIITDRVLQWRAGLTVEISIDTTHSGGTLHVRFSSYTEGGKATSEGSEDTTDIYDQQVTAEGILSVPAGVKLALAMYSPDDEVTVESVW